MEQASTSIILNETAHFLENEAEFNARLRKGLRAAATSVSLLTTRDTDGVNYGLTVNSSTPVSAETPSMIVAVNRKASAHPIILENGIFCLNQISSEDLDLLECFYRSDMRYRRFASERWRRGIYELPFLSSAITSFFCHVAAAHDYSDHTVFVGRIEGVRLHRDVETAEISPLIWMNGAPVRVAGRHYTQPPSSSGGENIR